MMESLWNNVRCEDCQHEDKSTFEEPCDSCNNTNCFFIAKVKKEEPKEEPKLCKTCEHWLYETYCDNPRVKTIITASNRGTVRVTEFFGCIHHSTMKGGDSNVQSNL